MSRIVISVHSTVGSHIGRPDGDGSAVSDNWPIGHGCVRDTLGEDGRPVEALVLMEEPALPGVEVPARPIAVLHLTDAAHTVNEMFCVSDSPRFIDLTDVSDMTRWRAEPDAWVSALARLVPGMMPQVTICEARTAADRLLEEARHDFLAAGGCLE
jgi:inorganic pyrophosphatase